MKKFVALSLVLCLLLALCACGQDQKQDETPADDTPQQETQPQTPAETPEMPQEPETPQTPEQPQEPDDEENIPHISGPVSQQGQLFYELDSHTATFTDGAGNECTTSYAIPAFNIDSPDASAMNTAIETFCRQYTDEMDACETEGYSPYIYSVSYETHQSGSYASIVVLVDLEGDDKIYQVYNINTETGAAATGAELISAAGFTEQSFLEAVQQATSDCFWKTYDGLQEDEFCKEQYDKTMSADNFSLSMPMYLDEAGTLQVVVPIFAIAGAEYYENIISLTA